MRDRNLAGWLAVGVPGLVIAGLLALILLVLVPSAARASCGPAAAVDLADVPSTAVAGYSGDQLTNAALIMNAGADMGLQRDAQVIAVMTAMGESGLRVLEHGDAAGPDSRGLFQQRDNGAWGTLADRLDPTTSARNFYTALIAVPGWQQLPPTIAAHRVQGNADPEHYESFYAAAIEVVGTLAGAGDVVCQSGYLVFPLEAGFQMTDDYGPRPCPFATRPCPVSTWHPAVDLQNVPGPCGAPVYAVTAGTVTYAAGYQLSIKSPEGYTVSYLHMYPSDVLVAVGDAVIAGQQVGRVGSNGPSTGCHLDLRINVVGNTNATVAALPRSESVGGPVGWVSPEEFYEAFGLELCAPDSCRRLTQ